MSKKQFYGIKYPFTSESDFKFFLDANESVASKVRSQIMHVVFTPKGQRIMAPEFGTDLIKAIFEQSDGETWDLVKKEVGDAVSKFVPNAVIDDIQVVQNTEVESEVFVKLMYTVSYGNKSVSDAVVVKL
jgi:phage baseplate assembly protein W